MKFLVTLALVLVAAIAVSAISEEKKAKLKEYGKQCIESTGIEAKKAKSLRTGGFSDDPELKEFVACVWQKTGTLKADGTYDKDVIARDLADNPTIRDIALKCADVTGSTPAETAYLSSKCVKANLPAGYKSPL